MIDAYMHVGGPRFGAASLALREMERHDLTHANIVLPPAMPDFAALAAAREAKGDRVRLFGIPFGETEGQREELTRWQIAFGVSGFRLMPHEIAANAASLALLGEHGRCLMAINPYDSTEVQRTLLRWLETHPAGYVACPHFFKPMRVAEAVEDVGLFHELLRHPRFFVIFSRHGKTGTGTQYPHPDLKPWVEDVVAETGWEKVMWGSEYPVLFWRDEQIPEAAAWLGELMPELSPEALLAFRGENARRIFFAQPTPAKEAGAPPAWLAEQAGSGFAVPIAQNGVRLSDRLTQQIMEAYAERDESMTLSDFFAAYLEKRL